MVRGGAWQAAKLRRPTGARQETIAISRPTRNPRPKVSFPAFTCSLLRQVDGLGAALRPELVEEAARVGLHRVLADGEPLADLAVAQAGGDQAEDLHLAGRDGERALTLGVGDEGCARRAPPTGGCGRGSAAVELRPQPDAESASVVAYVMCNDISPKRRESTDACAPLRASSVTS